MGISMTRCIRALLLGFGLATAAFSQDDPGTKPLDLELSGATLEHVVEILATQTGLLFVLRPEVDEASRATRYTVRRKGTTLREALDLLFDGSELAWSRSGARVTIDRGGKRPGAADRPFLEIENPFTTGTLEMTVPTSDQPR
jgi:hypothetical protein